MNRKPIFDAVRRLLHRGFTRTEVEALDAACAEAENPHRPPAARQLGALSARFESGGRGPGTVSSGTGDPGEISYGIYQFASKTGTCRSFLQQEGSPWAAHFGTAKPGESAFTAAWKVIATQEPDLFANAQHAFIERTHYHPLVSTIRERTGLDLDTRAPAVRDVAWSCAVQHGGAARFMTKAIAACDRRLSRTAPGYDRALIEDIYRERNAYVRAVSERASLPDAQRNQLKSLVLNRYPQERAAALAMLASVA